MDTHGNGPDILHLADGYSRLKHPEVRAFRPMTPDEARALGYNSPELYFADPALRTFRRCRVNGAPKTWKREPARVELPIKYGLRECARAVARRGRMELPNGGILLVPVQEQEQSDR